MDEEQVAGFFDAIGREDRLRSTLSAAAQSDSTPPPSLSAPSQHVGECSARDTSGGRVTGDDASSGGASGSVAASRGASGMAASEQSSSREAGSAGEQAGGAVNGTDTALPASCMRTVDIAVQAELDKVLADLASFQPGRRVVLELTSVTSTEGLTGSTVSENAGGQESKKNAARVADGSKRGNNGSVAFRVVQVTAMASDIGAPSAHAAASTGIAAGQSVADAASSSSHQRVSSPPGVSHPLSFSPSISPSSRFAAVLLDALPESLPPTALPCAVFLVPQVRPLASGFKAP